MKVVLLPAAERDLDKLHTYIKETLQNPIAARNLATKILQRAQSLAKFPEMGASLDRVDAKLTGYRYLIVDNYLVIYRVTHTEVCIVRVLYARSQYVQLLH